MISKRGISGLVVAIGCLVAACSKQEAARPWYSPEAGDGTEDMHAIILDGTTNETTTATVHFTYRCPSSQLSGGKLTAHLSKNNTNVHWSDKDNLPVTCDGVEHTFDVQFEGAFPADDRTVSADILMWLPDGPSTTIPGIAGTPGMISTSLRETASDDGHHLNLKRA